MGESFFEKSVTGFEENVKFVLDLAQFDELVVTYAIRRVEIVQERCRKHNVDPYWDVHKELEQLKNIRKNASTQSSYEHIFNQCVVLLVSYFGSAVSDICTASINEFLSRGKSTAKLTAEKLQFTVDELFTMGSCGEHIGELLVNKKGISFQDMQSIHKAFKDYCNVDLKRDKDVNNIIVGHACRHIIVHDGATVNDKCRGQVAKANPRTLKKNLKDDEHVQFDVEELKILSKSMSSYMGTLTGKLDSVLNEGGSSN